MVEELTRSTVGTAAVFTVSSDAVEALNETLPPSLHVEAGHIRSVAPNVNMDNPDLRRYPLLTPSQIAQRLGPDGQPTEEARQDTAYGPRRQLLDAALPAHARRTLSLLARQERRAELARQVDEDAEVVEASQAASSASRGALASAEPSADRNMSGTGPERGTNAFPRRRDRHHASQEADGFWRQFWTLLSRWLDKPVAEMSEGTIEKDLLELDERIVRERRELAIQEDYLSKVEESRSFLEMRVADLQDENASLAAQLEATGGRLDEARAQVESLVRQLDEMGTAPAPTPEPDRDAELRHLSALRQKLTLSMEEVDAREEVDDRLAEGDGPEPPTEPDASALVRDDGAQTPTIGAGRMEYEPWLPVKRGRKEHLDNLYVRSAQQRVEEMVSEIVEFEGPIALPRLLLVGNGFGLTRLWGRRRKELTARVRATGLTIDADGFVWPEPLDPESWTEFRPNGSDVPRSFTDVSPVEIRNAARVLKRNDPDLVGEDFERALLRTFGRTRLTSGVSEHLRTALGEDAS